MTLFLALLTESAAAQGLASSPAAHPHIIILRHLPGSPFENAGIGPLGIPNGTGLTPTQVRHAYGLDTVTFQGGAIHGDGSGQTVAIVDAFDQPNLPADLQAFDAAAGIADPPKFTKMDQNGGTTLPVSCYSNSRGWGSEINLDVEWVHSIAPGANILLVEAASDNTFDLVTAAQTAAAQPGVVAVSMSWGSDEYAGETTFDHYFAAPPGHNGVTFFASTGDNGSPGGYPAYSPAVVAVGGTKLTVDAIGDYGGETGWSLDPNHGDGGGGGVSTQEAQPTYQIGVTIAGGTNANGHRTIPDVSSDADPQSGVAIYESHPGGWFQVGGTSLSSPCWAAVMAVVDQGRALAGLGSLDTVKQTLPKLYDTTTVPSADFHDPTSGSNGGFSAGVGYDLVTGLGSPKVPLIAADLGAGTCTRHAPTVGVSPSTQAAHATNQLRYTVSVTDNDSADCPASSFLLAMSIPAGWSGAFFPIASPDPITSLNLHPGEAHTANLEVTSAAGATLGNYNLIVNASNAGGVP